MLQVFHCIRSFFLKETSRSALHKVDSEITEPSIEQIRIQQSVETFISREILVKDRRSVYSELEQVLARDVAGKEEFQGNRRDWFVV